MTRTTVSGEVYDNSIASVTPGSGVACGPNHAVAIDVQAITTLARRTSNTTASWRATVVVVRAFDVVHAWNENRRNTLHNDGMGVESRLVFSALRCLVGTSVNAIADHSRIVVGDRESGTGGSRNQHIGIRDRTAV